MPSDSLRQILSNLQAGTATSPLDAISVEETAREVLLRLSRRQLSILADRVEKEETLETLAERYGVSRGTVDNELRRTMAIIAESVTDDRNLKAVLEKLLDLAS
jgi:hypothetical protein